MLKSYLSSTQTLLFIAIVPHNQPIAILLEAELQWVVWSVERKNHDRLVHVFECWLQPNLQAAEWRLIRRRNFECAGTEYRTLITEPNPILICQPIYVILEERIEGPESSRKQSAYDQHTNWT